MNRTTAVCAPPRTGLRAVLAALLLAVALVAWPNAAWANEEETDEAALLVLQSVSLIANNASTDAVVERIEDALDAPDQTGVQRDAVEQALQIVEQASGTGQERQARARARDLLAGAVRVRFATGYGNVPEPGEVDTGEAPYASGAEPGTSVVLDELRPVRGIADGGDIALFALSAAAVIAGLYLSRRWRPGTSIGQLRRRSAAMEETR